MSKKNRNESCRNLIDIPGRILQPKDEVKAEREKEALCEGWKAVAWRWKVVSGQYLLSPNLHHRWLKQEKVIWAGQDGGIYLCWSVFQ